MVGFHDSRWAAAFLACCERFLRGCEVRDREVAYRGRRTRVAVTTFPLDTEAVARLAKEPLAWSWHERLAVPAAGRRVIVRADRLDLWKNHLRGFAAYRTLLESEPELTRQWWFCAVTTTPTRGTERSRDYQRRCEAMVAEINEQFGSAERPAVSLVYPDSLSTRHCVAAVLSQAAVTLVNPTIDGMNLVAKEALFLAQRSPLLLSVNAGAYEHVAPHVTPVQPFDVAATGGALRSAMSDRDHPEPDPLGRRDEVVRLLAGSGPTGWLPSSPTAARGATGDRRVYVATQRGRMAP